LSPDAAPLPHRSFLCTGKAWRLRYADVLIRISYVAAHTRESVRYSPVTTRVDAASCASAHAEHRSAAGPVHVGHADCAGAACGPARTGRFRSRRTFAPYRTATW